MQGHDLAAALEGDTFPREAALFGLFGGHVNVTDGRHVYMRAAADPSNGPLENYTLMPTHMRARFSVAELTGWEPAEPFTFTKGVRTMNVRARAPFINPWRHGTLLFDLATDPHQEHPLDRRRDRTADAGTARRADARIRRTRQPVRAPRPAHVRATPTSGTC